MMNSIYFTPMPTADARAFQAGAFDANGQAPEQHISDGDVPCRHCLDIVPEGEPFLLVAYRPFPDAQPYAEVGPVFLHSTACEAYEKSADIPPFLNSEQYIVRGYDKHNRIVYGSGSVVLTADIPTYADRLFTNDTVDYIHVRSASNNCFHCRIEQQ